MEATSLPDIENHAITPAVRVESQDFNARLREAVGLLARAFVILLSLAGSMATNSPAHADPIALEGRGRAPTIRVLAAEPAGFPDAGGQDESGGREPGGGEHIGVFSQEDEGSSHDVER